jgi:hypothetical protein
MDQEEANPCRDPIKDGIVLDVTQRNLGVEINWKTVNKGSVLHAWAGISTNKKITSLKRMSLPRKKGSYHDES